MSDPVDEAQKREAYHREESLVLDRLRRQTPPARAKKGICGGCGEAIPDARMESVPSCTRCVDCEDAAERHLQRFAGGRR